jgi:DNA polymerase-1
LRVPDSAPRVVLVDGTNSIYRAFFAPMTDLRATDGTPTKAVLVFTNMLLKTLREESPDYCAVVFDARGKTFRHEVYPEYKAGREAQPEDLAVQFPLAREIVAALAIPMLEAPGVEADDLIACLVRCAPPDARISIVSTDRDLMQLVGERVQLLDGIRDRRYGPAEVEARFGVPPAQLLDLRALVGDTSDNIPGVHGIGEKGGAQLIREWGDLETLLAHSGEVKNKRAREALLAHAEDARLSKRLATLRDDIPFEVDYERYRRVEPDRARLRDLYRRLEFVRLLESLDAETPAPRSDALVGGGVDIETPAPGEWAALAARIATLPSVVIECVDEGGSAIAARPLGVAIAASADRATWLPLAGDASFEALAAALAPVLAGDVAWIGANTKRIQALFAERGAALPVPWFDVELAGQLLDTTGAQGVSALAAQLLGRAVPTWEDLAGRGARQITASFIPASQIAQWAGERAAAVAALRAPLAERLDGLGLTDLYEEVELPLTGVLAEMERAGVRIDEGVLAALSRDYVGQLGSIEKQIYAAAGQEFLISSPKQLQEILFEKLKLPVVRKTKTGYSTDEAVLEQLAAVHELPERILAHRRLSKLVNTYVEALPRMVDPRTGRVHPTYHQIGAATGRMSGRIRTCRTSRFAPRRACGSARRSCPPRVVCWCRRTTRRSSCAFSRTSRTTTACARRSAAVTTSTARPPPKSGRWPRSRSPVISARARKPSTSGSSTGCRRSASRISSASPPPRRRRRSRPISRATRACARSSTTRSPRPGATARSARCSADGAHCPTSTRAIARCARPRNAWP